MSQAWEVAVVRDGRARLVTGRAARMIHWLAEFAPEINREKRGKVHFFFAGPSLVFSLETLRVLDE